MKVGMRKPSIKKSIKARTTVRAKRAVKKAVTPGYGKKGMGWLKDPKRAAYNKVYSKTTVGVSDLIKTPTAKSSKNPQVKNDNQDVHTRQNFQTHTSVLSGLSVVIRLIAAILVISGFIALFIVFSIGVVGIISGVILWNISGIYLNKFYSISSNNNNEYALKNTTPDETVLEGSNFDNYEKEFMPVWNKYYPGMQKIETDWSTLYNSKNYTGDASYIFETSCRKNILLYKQMFDISRKYKQENPPSAPAYKRLAMLYERRGDFEKAISVCKEALSIGVNTDDTSKRLGRLIKKAGRTPTDEELALLK